VLDERKLWVYVLLRAALDLQGRNLGEFKAYQALIQTQAKGWFLSSNYHIGSFRWICDLFGLDPATIRRWVFALAANNGNGVRMHQNGPGDDDPAPVRVKASVPIGGRQRTLDSEPRPLPASAE
jgi:hypothetical protein